MVSREKVCHVIFVGGVCDVVEVPQGKVEDTEEETAGEEADADSGE